MNQWDVRFASENFYYGEKPNVFFAGYLSKLKRTGKLLLPAEGEGRNAVFAAKQGWEVHAFDSSAVAMKKALAYADAQNVNLNYEHLDIAHFDSKPDSFDLIALIFVHQPEGMRQAFHHKLVKSLKKGGILLTESFAKEQINNNSGGPPDINMLYSAEILKQDFEDLKTLKLCRENIMLEEGHHMGEAEVVRFVGQKR